jgi:hypothetical protein
MRPMYLQSVTKAMYYLISLEVSLSLKNIKTLAEL